MAKHIKFSKSIFLHRALQCFSSQPCSRTYTSCKIDTICFICVRNKTIYRYSKTFKTRYYGHSRSFREKESEHSTTLSTHIWKLKNKNKNFNVRWEVVARANDFNPISRKCQLCLKEKYYILFHQGGATLNKRSELFSTCRHRLRRLLSNT